MSILNRIVFAGLKAVAKETERVFGEMEKALIEEVEDKPIHTTSRVVMKNCRQCNWLYDSVLLKCPRCETKNT